ncbi:MAG: ABC transporter substrate-binding protein [Desulfobacteraceae bacterium]|nr:ABC transporter substrate-binding protein [Desulfobacteraceae bacterium]
MNTHTGKLPLSAITRRQFLQTAATACSSLAFARTVSAKKRKLRLGYLPITDATPLLVAHGLGYFSREGLDVERPVMVRSWNILTESFMANKFDITHMLFPIPVWMRFRQNMPVRVLAWDHTNGSAVTVRGDSAIKNFSDLGGKQVAVPSWYSMHNLVLQLGLKARGLVPVIQPQSAPLKSHEVNLFILPPPDMPTEEVLLQVFETPDPKQLVHPHWNVPRIDFQPFPFPSATRFIIEQMKTTRVEGDTAFLTSLDPDRATRDLVDDRFVLQAMDEMGGMAPFCNCNMTLPYEREESVEIS